MQFSKTDFDILSDAIQRCYAHGLSVTVEIEPVNMWFFVFRGAEKILEIVIQPPEIKFLPDLIVELISGEGE